MKRSMLILLLFAMFLVVSALPVGTSAQIGTKIKLYKFLDAREGKLDPYLIGVQTAAFGVILGDVYSERPVVENVTEAVKSELIRMGYNIVSKDEDFIVKGKVLQFFGKTPVKMHTWNVIGEVSLAMEVSRPGQRSFTMLGPYTDRKVEGGVFKPGKRKMKRVLAAALTSVIQKMSSDPTLLSALSERKKN